MLAPLTVSTTVPRIVLPCAVLGILTDARGDAVDDAMSLGHDRLACDPGGTRDRALLYGTVGVVLGRQPCRL